MTALLQVEHLKKYYSVARERRFLHRTTPSFLHAVDDVSFSLAPGEAVGLVGESGSGKSTLSDLIAKLTVPTQGRIIFQGQDLSAETPREFARSPLRSQIQMVFQDAGESWNPRFTAFEAIADPLKRLVKTTPFELRKRVLEAAGMVGFPAELLGRYPHQLSGGQRARVGIARAIVVEPRLLILDEPTSALDVSIQAVILQLLKNLRSRLNCAYIFVSHDLNIVRLLCDRVMIMYLGRVVEHGPTERIFEKPMHPYTACLIDGIPGRKGKQRRSFPLTGDPRSPVDPDPNVCRFFGRCPMGRDGVCTKREPVLEPADLGGAVACHFPIGAQDMVAVGSTTI